MTIDKKFLLSVQVIEMLKNPDALKAKMNEGGSFQQILGFSDDAVVGFYDTAKELMDQKRYGDAGDAFFFLTQLAPQVRAFWLGLARSEKLNGQIERAIPLYVAAIALDQSDKDSYIECVQCCLEADKHDEAVQILELALEYASENPQEPQSKELHDTALECTEWILAQKNRKG